MKKGKKKKKEDQIRRPRRTRPSNLAPEIKVVFIHNLYFANGKWHWWNGIDETSFCILNYVSKL